MAVSALILLLILYLFLSTLFGIIGGSGEITIENMRPGTTIARMNKETGEKELIQKSPDGKTTIVQTAHGSTEITEQDDGTTITKSTELEDGGLRTRIVVRLPDPTAAPAFRGKASAMHGLPDLHQSMLQGIADRMNGDLSEVPMHEAEHHDGASELGAHLLEGLMQSRDPFAGSGGLMMIPDEDGEMMLAPSPPMGEGLMLPGGVHVVHLGNRNNGGMDSLMNALMPQMSLEDMFRHAIIQDIMEDINTKFKDVPDKFKDPVTHALLDEPVHIHWPGDEIFTDVAFEKHQVTHWFSLGHTTNPYNDEPGVTNTAVIDLPELKEEIKKWKSDHPDMIHLQDNEAEEFHKSEKRVLVIGSEEDDSKKETLKKEFEGKGFDSIDIRNFGTVQEFIDEPEFHKEKYHAIYDIGLLPKAYKDTKNPGIISTFWGKVETLFAAADSEFITTNQLDPETVKEGHEKACKAQGLPCHSLKIQALKNLGGGAHWTRWRREL